MTNVKHDLSRWPLQWTPFMPRPVDRPLVIAHRGLPTVHPENTLAGFDAALRAGADAIECDVRLAHDGQLVVVHDRLHADGRPTVSLSHTTRRSLEMPLIEDVLALMHEWPDRGLVIEAKTVDAATELLRRFQPPPRSSFISFSDHSVREALLRGWCASYVSRQSASLMLDLTPDGASMGPHFTTLEDLPDEYLRACNVWTVDFESTAVELADREVYALTTNRTIEILQAVKQRALTVA